LKSLAPHARLFVVRRTHEGGPNNENKALAWLISTSFDGGGVNYYSAANHEGRACNAPLLLRWHAMETFAKEGVITYDFMGVDSPRSPSLKGVGDFKRQFGPEVEVEGAWDVPIIMWRYQTLKAALRIKKFVLR